ncbi:hypothetical protein P389DRAFT_174067 [Cystobasidium minutum MCA 4210]|uniref:uncharacterized protein n=1 Tax=Cystobasidium minutum MCA 4210 TaxID=1397322 RepID=UPI0034CE49FF|eukprot:jgi/Rhomi1/174067/fgenesh1_kg.7_\
MDDSLYANLPGSQGSSQEDGYRSTATRFGASSAHLNTRNLFDETMDLDAAGTADIPDEESGLHIGPSGSRRHDEMARNHSNDTQAARLPSSELQDRLHIRDHGTATTTAAAAATSSSVLNHESGIATHSSDKNEEDDLPTVPPLSAEQRREQALTRERDDLAKMNTLLEQAIASVDRTVPKIQRFQSTISKTHSLLDTYTKVLSQAEHTQNLLLDGSWEPQRDEDEIREAQEAEERRRREEEERIAREQREAEEREARIQEQAERKAAATSRGRGVPVRGTTRGVPSSRARASSAQRGSTVRGTARGRGTTATRGTTSRS